MAKPHLTQGHARSSKATGALPLGTERASLNQRKGPSMGSAAPGPGGGWGLRAGRWLVAEGSQLQVWGHLFGVLGGWEAWVGVRGPVRYLVAAPGTISAGLHGCQTATAGGFGAGQSVGG